MTGLITMGIVSLLMLTIIYMTCHIHTYIHTQGRFDNHTQCVSRIMIAEPSVMGVMNMGNIVPRGG